MTRSSLAELKARHKALQEKQQNRGNGSSDFYLFWNMQDGQEAEIRFLPDLSEENDFVYSVDKYMHNLSINGKRKKVACLEMWNEECPVCKTSREFYKMEGDNSVRGSALWKKKSQLARAMILKDPLPADENGPRVGKVMTLEMGKEVSSRVINDMARIPDDESPPWDMDNGFNFIIKKASKGKWPDYSGSSFAWKPSAVPAQYRANWVLIDLRTLLPANPGIEKVVALLEAHMNGTDYEDNGNDSSGADTSAPTSTAHNVVEEKLQDDSSIPFEATTSSAANIVADPVVALTGTANTTAGGTVTTSTGFATGARLDPAPTTPSVAPADDGNVSEILAKIRQRNKNKV